ncbi:hypothetical protein DV714_12220 [Parageobacillus thermoglucosidasius]|nr:hypothetical protein GT20_1952 [Parageobacillus thermoglucosidasius TNO-09.020]KYD17175.1 hypothetical protein B4168_1575 [Anoxybacillus flavithermus]OAO84229.1 hypothetical protein GT23_3764 [Parageobacillus thermoglucosidasius]RDE26954.1 hypothetical protein DV714_12220 [Parageobacillus thermoglucosidasius]
MNDPVNLPIKRGSYHESRLLLVFAPMRKIPADQRICRLLSSPHISIIIKVLVEIALAEIFIKFFMIVR